MSDTAAYRSADGTETRRLAEPHRLVSAGRRWYLVAFDNDRDDWRIFRVDRIREPLATGVRATPRALPAEDAAAFVTAVRPGTHVPRRGNHARTGRATGRPCR